MSDDLISRKEVLAVITPRLNSSKIGSLENQRLYSISEEVKNMPTAYDVDKVVERLEEKVRGSWGYPSAMEFDDVIRIVKSGGIE